MSIQGGELFLLVLLPASLYDISQYRIPNALIVPALLAGLFRQWEEQGFQGLCSWFAGILFPFILCYLFYRCRMLGASDSKMLSAVGCFVGAGSVLRIIVGALFIGAIMAVCKMILKNNFRHRLLRLSNYVSCCVQEKRLTVYYDRATEGDDGLIPFAVAISLSTILCVY